MKQTGHRMNFNEPATAVKIKQIKKKLYDDKSRYRESQPNSRDQIKLPPPHRVWTDAR